MGAPQIPVVPAGEGIPLAVARALQAIQQNVNRALHALAGGTAAAALQGKLI